MNVCLVCGRGAYEGVLTISHLACVEQLTAERDALRDTNQRLNRRAQLAESAVIEKIQTHPDASFGRILAGAGYGIAVRRAEKAEAKLALLKADILDLTVNHSDVRMGGVVQYAGNVAVRDIHRMLEQYGCRAKDSSWTAREDGES